MEYFYTPPQLISSSELTIEGEEFNHLTHVMRKRTGDAIRVVNGIGTAYDATIVDIRKREARCEITHKHERLNEPRIDVTIGVALLKNASKFDFLVEKVTELGVNTIVPLLTERTIPRHAKTDRWQKLALAAMKQSCRCVLPVVKELQPFHTFITSFAGNTIKLIPHERAGLPIAGVVPTLTSPSVAFCIGPEGGFTDPEIALAGGASFQPISLGPRRLRTETAAIVTAGIILTAG